MPGETENHEDWQQIRLPYHDREMYVPDEDEVDPLQFKIVQKLIKKIIILFPVKGAFLE
jgi:hypothetical protein